MGVSQRFSLKINEYYNRAYMLSDTYLLHFKQNYKK